MQWSWLHCILWGTFGYWDKGHLLSQACLSSCSGATILVTPPCSALPMPHSAPFLPSTHSVSCSGVTCSGGPPFLHQLAWGGFGLPASRLAPFTVAKELLWQPILAECVFC